MKTGEERQVTYLEGVASEQIVIYGDYPENLDLDC